MTARKSCDRNSQVHPRSRTEGPRQPYCRACACRSVGTSEAAVSSRFSGSPGARKCCVCASSNVVPGHEKVRYFTVFVRAPPVTFRPREHFQKRVNTGHVTRVGHFALESTFSTFKRKTCPRADPRTHRSPITFKLSVSEVSLLQTFTRLREKHEDRIRHGGGGEQTRLPVDGY